jgi:DNA-binding response OmpR family regulator
MQNVLIVEDNVSVNHLYSRHLSRAGYSVIQAVSCDEALSTLQRGTPDAVLLDMTLPDGDGNEIIQRIRDLNMQTQIAIVSGDRDYGTKKVIPGVDHYLFKPVATLALLETVRAMLFRLDTTNPTEN